MKALLTFCLAFATPLNYAQDDLAIVKERMNNYYDQKIQRTQMAKDCLLAAMTLEEVNECKTVLEEDVEDLRKRLRENQNR